MGDHEHMFFWYPAVNEDGWKCCLCGFRPGEPPGFSPELDRSETYTKVDGLLRDLHENGLVHVSNGSHGDAISSAVAEQCRKTGAYDQYSILRSILEGMASHAEHWRAVSEGVLSGSDPRHRCPCGELSTSSSSRGNGAWAYRCGRHFDIRNDEDVPNGGGA